MLVHPHRRMKIELFPGLEVLTFVRFLAGMSLSGTFRNLHIIKMALKDESSGEQAWMPKLKVSAALKFNYICIKIRYMWSLKTRLTDGKWNM